VEGSDEEVAGRYRGVNQCDTEAPRHCRAAAMLAAGRPACDACTMPDEPRRRLTRRTTAPAVIVLRGDGAARMVRIAVGDRYSWLADLYGRADETVHRLRNVLHVIHLVEQAEPQAEDNIDSVAELAVRTVGKGVHILALLLAVAAVAIWQRVKMAAGVS
jgi:hypothetical protein